MILFTKTKTDTPESIEGENLATHIVLCRQRDQSIKERMDEIEQRQINLESRESDIKSYILRTVTTAAIALISSAFSLGIMLSQYGKH